MKNEKCTQYNSKIFQTDRVGETV